MNHHKLSQQMISIGLVFLFVVGCSAPATSTPVPLTVTPTPIPPTPTPTLLSGPKIGHWEGQPSVSEPSLPPVSFEIRADGKIHDFKMEVKECTFTSDDISVEADGTFTFTFRHEFIEEDENIIQGKFESDTAVSGSRSMRYSCVNPSTGQAVFGVWGGDMTWKAEWKGP